MAITYSWVIKKLDTAEINGIQNVVSHIHFDYVGTDESGNTAFCQGAMAASQPLIPRTAIMFTASMFIFKSTARPMA